MKIYLILIALFITSVSQAQVKDPYMGGYIDGGGQEQYEDSGSPSGFTSSPMAYTPSTSSGEWTHTNQDGTTIDVTWSVSGTTLYWESTLNAGSGVTLGLHRLHIFDDGYGPGDQEEFADDDFEDGDSAGWGSDYWHSSGSADIGSSYRIISFSFENIDTYSGSAAYDNIFEYLYYNEPL